MSKGRLRKHLMIYLVGLLLIAGQFGFLFTENTYGQTDGAGAKASGGTILTFTSDVHNKTDDISADRLASWIDEIQSGYGKIDAMGFCGDMANSIDGPNYWRNTKAVMDTVSSKGVDAIYTTGNHEYESPNDSHIAEYVNGSLMSLNENGQPVADRFTINAAGKEGSNYHIYCLGAESRRHSYSEEQRQTMWDYLNDIDDDKPVIIMTHFPLHYFGDERDPEGSEETIDLLNMAATNDTPEDTSDDRTIIFLWGHNHSESDWNYDQIYTPGESINYSSDTDAEKQIDFYYAAAGCMSDSELSPGSASVQGKGLVIQVRPDEDTGYNVGFAYCNAAGTDVTESGDYPKIVKANDPVTGLSLDRSRATVSVGKSTRITAAFNPLNAANKQLTWTSSDTSVATVQPEQNGSVRSAKVRGISAGTAVITATSEDGGFTASAEVTVRGTAPELFFVIRIDNYILSSHASADMMTNAEGYEYHGLGYVKYKTGTAVPYHALWKVEPVSGVQNGYHIISTDGKYLSASYESNGTGYTGTLSVGSTKDVWIAEEGMGNWQSNNCSPLRSTNASDNPDNKAKYLAMTTGDGNTSFFTIRSSSTGTRLIIPEMIIEPTASAYPVMFLDEDGDELKATKFAEGDIPVFGKTVPAKESDEQHDYTFAGWSDGTNTYGTDEALPAVTGPATYTAVFEAAGHAWDSGVVTKAPTETQTGTRLFTCTVCGKTRTETIPAKGYAPGNDPDQMGTDGTAVGPGASAAAADKAITTMTSDKDPKGAKYLPLKTKSTKQTKTSVTVSWAKQSKAAKYVIYGNLCGKANKPKKLGEATGASKSFSKIAGKKVAKGKAYKFIIVALDKDNNVVSTSKMIHVYTKGGKYTNHKAVKVKAKVKGKYKVVKSVSLKKGKTKQLKAKGVKYAAKKKYLKHVAMRFESSKKAVATVSSKGVIKGKKKGTCYVYAYSQNGIAKKIKVTVK